MNEEKQQIRPFFRVMNTDLIGEKPIARALLKIRGVGFSLANTICNVLNIPKAKKAGLLTDDDAKRIEHALKTGEGLPVWMLNRRFDEVTGENLHLSGGDLKFAIENDIKKLKRIRAYKGFRHALGQPVRGQRTRSHFRQGSSVGVAKAKLSAKPAAAPAKEKGKK